MAVLLPWQPVAGLDDHVAAGMAEGLGGIDTAVDQSHRVLQGGWSVNGDNDLFVGRGRDRDYTGGISVTWTRPFDTQRHPPGQVVLDYLDRWSGFAGYLERTGAGAPFGRAAQVGVLALTPERLDTALPEAGDRPYASLTFVSVSRYTLHAEGTRLLQSTFTGGLLGTSVAEQLHRRIHSAFGLRVPEGYGRQISAGGEVTMRYAVAQRVLMGLVDRDGHGHDWYRKLEGSLGMLTEMSIGVGLRWGRRSTPWWSDASDYGEYAAQPAINAGAVAPRDFYFVAGLKARVRLYNALVRGQLRSSDSALRFSDTVPVIADAWLGFVRSAGVFRISYTIRYQTPELRRGVGARSQLWASISVARATR